MRGNQWARLVAYVTGVINPDLLLQNEYLAAENRILRAHLPQRLRLTDPERMTLADIGNGLGARLSPGLPESRKAGNDSRLVQEVDRPEVRRLQVS